jgi:uncharacterized protein YegJ (DUF2314 family)
VNKAVRQQLIEHASAMTRYAVDGFQNDLDSINAALDGTYAQVDSRIAEVSAAIERIIDAYGRSPAIRDGSVPEQFWLTDVGYVVAKALLWVMSDRLITVRQAAAIMFRDDLASGKIDEHYAGILISRLMDAGRLKRYADYTENNPNKRGRVDRMQLEQLMSQPPPAPMTDAERKAAKKQRLAALRAKGL